MRLSRHFRHLCPGLREGIDRGCSLLFAVVLVAVLHRHFWQDGSDTHQCEGLLAGGRWLDNTYRNWQPSGCMMHKYQEDDLVNCFKGRRLALIGDSAIRQIFWAIARKLSLQEQIDDRHANFALSPKGFTIEFIWDPYLNSSRLRRETLAASLSTEDDRVADTAAILLIGGGLWHARYLDELYLAQFKDSVQAISQTMYMQDDRYLEKLGSKPRQRPFNLDSLMILAPAPVPAYNLLTPSRAITMTPERIESMNDHLHHISTERPLSVAWSYLHMAAGQDKVYQSDGLHVIQDVATNMADVVLNLRCNAVLRTAQIKAYPMDKTCCTSYGSPSWTQAVFLKFSTWLLPWLVMVTSQGSGRINFMPSRKITHAIMTLALAVCYCYYADRTQLFNKAQKQYRNAEFFTLGSIFSLLGLLSVRQTTTRVHSEVEVANLRTRDEPFLSRHQTDEWKGWMQCIILIYHYTGASKILWIYEIIRLLVASYLFLSGFGHTVFFYRTANYSLHRCVAVLLRLNMLSCILPYVMSTDYIFYYFAPLISFWYLVIYITMTIGHSRNHSLPFLLGKIAISATLVTALIRYPKVFKVVFWLLRKICNVRWDVKEWRFRLQLDNCIVYIGMLCALLFIRIDQALRSDGPGNTSSDRLIQRYFRRARLASGAFAILLFPIFFILGNRVTTKQEYNSWVPYVSPLPVLSFVVLRNFSRRARNLHSSIFAWIGRHSLETFTLQFHIWLAADTKGLLALGVVEGATGGKKNGRRFDMAVLTIIFLWVCWHVAAATQTLTSWLIDPREGRNEIGADEGVVAQEEEIPRTKCINNLKRSSSMAQLVDEVGVGLITSASRLKRMVAGDLKVRLAIIIGIMWVLNIVGA